MLAPLLSTAPVDLVRSVLSMISSVFATFGGYFTPSTEGSLAHNMFKRLVLSYSSGLLAALSPCVIVLIPLMLVRFVRKTAPANAPHPASTSSSSAASTSNASVRHSSNQHSHGGMTTDTAHSHSHNGEPCTHNHSHGSSHSDHIELASSSSSSSSAGSHSVSLPMSAHSGSNFITIPLSASTNAKNAKESDASQAKYSHAHSATAAASHPSLLHFTLGFQCSYLLFGYVLSKVLTSSIQTGFRMGLGGMFVVLFALSLTNRLDPLNLPLFNNTFFMGWSFALLISFNPCTVPFLAIIISLNTADALVALFFFGQGLLTPAIIFVYIGRRFTSLISRSSMGMYMYKLNKLMSFVLGASGVYLLLNIKILSSGDVHVAMLMLLVGVVLSLGAFELFSIWDKQFGTLRVRFVLFVCVLLSLSLPALYRRSAHHTVSHNEMEQIMSSGDGGGGGGEGSGEGDDSPVCFDVSAIHCSACTGLTYYYLFLTLALSVCVLVYDTYIDRMKHRERDEYKHVPNTEHAHINKTQANMLSYIYNSVLVVCLCRLRRVWGAKKDVHHKYKAIQI